MYSTKIWYASYIYINIKLKPFLKHLYFCHNYVFALFRKTSIKSTRWRFRSFISSRNQSRMSVATWSFRLRPVCSLPAAPPISSWKKHFLFIQLYQQPFIQKGTISLFILLSNLFIKYKLSITTYRCIQNFFRTFFLERKQFFPW